MGMTGYRLNESVEAWPDYYDADDTKLTIRKSMTDLAKDRPRFQLSTMDFILMTSLLLNLVLVILVIDLSIILLAKEMKLRVTDRRGGSNTRSPLNNQV